MNRINKAKHLLDLLLKTTENQANALLQTANPTQVLALSEIAHNICENPELNTKFNRKTKKQQLILKQLGNRKVREPMKYKLVHKHWQLVRQVVLQCKDHLLHLLS